MHIFLLKTFLHAVESVVWGTCMSLFLPLSHCINYMLAFGHMLLVCSIFSFSVNSINKNVRSDLL